MCLDTRFALISRVLIQFSLIFLMLKFQASQYSWVCGCFDEKQTNTKENHFSHFLLENNASVA